MKINNLAYHQNGTAGQPFYVVTFSIPEAKRQRRQMIATVFPDRGHIAVLDAKLVGRGVIEFGENSWRGADFEDEIRRAIEQFELQWTAGVLGRTA